MLYQSLLTLECSVAEKKGSYIALTERHLQAMWLEQKYMRPIKTAQGESIQILSPGLWNTEAGPDFLCAHIKIGNQNLRGDVEIHLNEQNWYAHRHHEDERYDKVILHVAFWTPSFHTPVITCSGQAIKTVHLENFMTIPLARLIQLIDLDLYPYKKFTGSGQCSQSLFKNLSEDKIKKLFLSAAYWRCEKKVEYLQSRFSERSLQLAAGISMALGYKHNADPFIDLFNALLSYRDLSEQELLAVALGSSGFFEDYFKRWEQSGFYQQLRHLWWAKKNEIDFQFNLRLDHIRPLNHPVRRMAYMVKLLQDPAMEDLWYKLMAVWCDFAAKDFSSVGTRIIKQQMLDLIPDYQDSYWSTHFLFEVQTEKSSLTFIGKDTKAEIIINVFIPLLHTLVRESDNPTWWESFQCLYQSFKGILTSKSRYLQHRFFGHNLKVSIQESALMTQGAYQIHKDFCLHYEASCEGCPFVQRFQAGLGSISDAKFSMPRRKELSH